MTVTQAQIARLAGVSRATVDRTLNNRGRVDANVAARIRKIADELGYSRNRAGSLLVRAKKPLRFGIVAQSANTSFMQLLLNEIEMARTRLRQLGAELTVRTLADMQAEQQLAVLDELAEQNLDGLAIMPVEDERICKRIDLLSESMPIVTFNTDLPTSRRLCYVGQDSYVSGRACAGLMNMLLGGSGKVLMVTGHMSNLSHQRRIDGFRSEILTAYSGLTLLPLKGCNDDRKTAFAIVHDMLTEQPDINGIYFSAGGAPGACDAIRELALIGQVHFICHDCTSENINNLRAGLVDFLIDQDPQTQAVRPLEILLDYILSGEKPASEYMLTRIDIRNKYNV